tara:strand:+ start:1181 stop:1816 length:636 start_codon:yes stop_codon:yes gene_type:complete
MNSEQSALQKLCNPKSEVSSHYFIKKNGVVFNLVPDLYEAWHAGKSNWKNYKSLNKNSIGIEICNPGHKNGYKNFSFSQILSLQKLLRHLKIKYKIKSNNILGHSDIAPKRKKDPGEKFPWKLLAKNNLSIWHGLKKDKIVYYRKKKITLEEKSDFLKNLYKIGYTSFGKNIKIKNKSYLIKAFQRRFRQELIDGKMDMECYMISKSLLKR